MTTSATIAEPVHLMSDDLPKAPSPAAPVVIEAPAIEVKPTPPSPASKGNSDAEIAVERERLQSLLEIAHGEHKTQLLSMLDALGPDPSPSMIDVALEIIQQRKWRVFPLHSPNPKNGLCTCGDPKCTSQGKHPRTANGFQDSSSSPDVIRQWWTRWSNANVGVPTGFQNHIAVLDVDPRHDGDKSLVKLEAKYGKLPATFTVKTGSGGFHFYFSRYTGPKLKSVSNALGDEYPGLDWKSEGGYVVGPGSLHVSGGRYEIVNDVALVDVPEWLETMLISPSGTNGEQHASMPFIAPEIIKEGARDTTIVAMATSLANKNIGETAVLAALLEFNRTRCSPPYDDAKIVAIVKRQCDFVRQNPAINPSSRPEAPAPVKTDPDKMPQNEVVVTEPSNTEELGKESDFIEDAIAVLKDGDPLEYLLVGFRYNHAGHEEISRALLYAFCAQSSGTSKGIQPEITGLKGSGKSHGICSTTFIMPQKYVWESSFSSKFLYYNPPPQGAIIFIDERLSDDMIDLVKRVMTNFQRETHHSTLVEKKPVKLIIPKRIVIIGATVSGGGDNQYNDRTVQVGILNSKADDEAYYEFESKRRAEGRPEFQINDHIEICRAMLLHIRGLEFRVTIPKIQFAYLHDKRLLNILYDFVEASAILNYMQRDHSEFDGVVTVTPNNKDLAAALDFEMFRMNNADAEGRLTRAETALHEKIQENIPGKSIEFTESKIAELYETSQNAIRKLLYGGGGTQNAISGGLIDKTPGWYTITQSTNPDIKGNVIRCMKVDRRFKGLYAVFTNELPMNHTMN